MSFWKNSAVLGVSGILVRLKGLVIMPLLAAQFGALGYGEWSQVLAIVLTFSPLIVMSTDSAFLRFYSGQEKIIQNRAFSALIIFLLCSGLVMGGIIMLLERGLASIFFGDSFELYLRLIPFAILYMLVGIQLNAFTMWLKVQGWVMTFSVTTVFQALLAVFSAFVLIYMGGGVIEFIAITIVAEVVLLALLLAHHAYHSGWARPEFSIIPKLVRFGIVLLPAAYAMWGLNWIDRLFLVEYTSLEEVGVYSLIYGIALMVVSLFGRPFRGMFPAQSAGLYNTGDFAGLQKLFNQSAGMLAGFLIPSIVGLSLVGSNVLSVLATPEFQSGAALLAIVTASYALGSLSSFYDCSLALQYRQIWSSISLVVALLVNVVFNALLIPDYGMTGAAWATLIAFGAQFLVSYGASLRGKIFNTDFGFVVQVVLSSIVMWLGVTALKEIPPLIEASDLVVLFMVSAIGAIFYATSLFVIWGKGRKLVFGYILERVI